MIVLRHQLILLTVLYSFSSISPMYLPCCGSEKHLLNVSACEEGPGLCALAMTVLSLFFIIITLPLSMLFVVKVVQEYERAVIFR